MPQGPLLIHCSAGVGRTGTLVALDSLTQELDEENQASIYNLIYDLRHQRNFLVQVGRRWGAVCYRLDPAVPNANSVVN